MDIERVAAQLGGEVVDRRKRKVLCPGPGHSDTDRSLAVSFLSDDAFLVHSFAGDPWQACRDHVSARLRLPAEWKRPSGAAVRRDMDSTALALSIWRETKPLSGTPAEAYLASRGITYAGEALRWHPNCPFGKDRVGCMVGLVQSIKPNKQGLPSEPQGIHRTAIDAQGRKLSHLGSNGRLSLGPTRGGAIKLTDDVERVLAIGEGIETTLSIRRLPTLENMPVWSVLSAQGIQAFPELLGVESIWIAADHDKSGTGQKAAQELAARLEAVGLEAIVIEPTTVGTDLNDL